MNLASDRDIKLQPLYPDHFLLHCSRLSVFFSVYLTTLTFSSFFVSLTSFYLLIVGVDAYCCDWSHAVIHTHSVELLWARDRPVAETSQHIKFTIDRHPCRRRDSNPQSQKVSGHWDLSVPRPKNDVEFREVPERWSVKERSWLLPGGTEENDDPQSD
jgi:hypothetical protein